MGGYRLHQWQAAGEPAHRIGYPLHGRLEGLYGAHVGDYRVEYDIDHEDRAVEVVRVALRADIYGIG